MPITTCVTEFVGGFISDRRVPSSKMSFEQEEDDHLEAMLEDLDENPELYTAFAGESSAEPNHEENDILPDGYEPHHTSSK